MPFTSWPPDQIIALNEIDILAQQNGWHDSQLFNYAKDYLLANDMLQAFYNYMINMKNPFAQIWADTFHHIRDYLGNNSLLPEYLTYLKTLSTVDPG
jgi:hypothetical protein